MVSGRKESLEEGVWGSSRDPGAGGVVTRRLGEAAAAPGQRVGKMAALEDKESPSSPLLPRDPSKPTAPQVNKLSSLGTDLLHWRGESQGNWMSLPPPNPQT